MAIRLVTDNYIFYYHFNPPLLCCYRITNWLQVSLLLINSCISETQMEELLHCHREPSPCYLNEGRRATFDMWLERNSNKFWWSWLILIRIWWAWSGLMNDVDCQNNSDNLLQFHLRQRWQNQPGLFIRTPNHKWPPEKNHTKCPIEQIVATKQTSTTNVTYPRERRI